jgi:D-aminopeptidase
MRLWSIIPVLILASGIALAGEARPRARDIGLINGVLPTGPLDAITDVAGVKVGHATMIEGTDVRTGVTAILPHGDNLYQNKVPAAIVVGNGFGKLAGSTQVQELGEIETPILLTGTLNVPRVADALIDWMLALPGNEEVRSVNPIVAETNDGELSDLRGRHVGRQEVFAALNSATGGPVAEGAVGAGTGTIAFGWKGGIGTASRTVPAAFGGYVVGVLVQTNYGGILTMNGAPVGKELGRYYLKDQLADLQNRADGSIIMVVATDAPVDSRNLRRLAERALFGLARTGSSFSNGSGDYVIAFSTAPRNAQLLGNDAMSPLFEAGIEATEEAIYNSLLKASTMVGRNGLKIEALPLDKTIEILKRYSAVK